MRQNGCHFADDTFKCIFLNKNARVSIQISLKFVPKGPINNNPALVQIMAWRQSGNKPLSESMMASLLTHICVTRPQWVKMHFTKGSWAHNWKLMEIVINVVMTVIFQLVHKFPHVMTAQLSWHVVICDLIVSSFFKWEKHEFLQYLRYELINHLKMKWTPDVSFNSIPHHPVDLSLFISFHCLNIYLCLNLF